MTIEEQRHHDRNRRAYALADSEAERNRARKEAARAELRAECAAAGPWPACIPTRALGPARATELARLDVELGYATPARIRGLNA